MIDDWILKNCKFVRMAEDVIGATFQGHVRPMRFPMSDVEKWIKQVMESNGIRDIALYEEQGLPPESILQGRIQLGSYVAKIAISYCYRNQNSEIEFDENSKNRFMHIAWQLFDANGNEVQGFDRWGNYKVIGELDAAAFHDKNRLPTELPVVVESINNALKMRESITKPEDQGALDELAQE